MRRKLFTFAAAVSAVLCVAVCVLWVRSDSVADSLRWIRSMRMARVDSWRGLVVLTGVDGRGDIPARDSFERRASPAAESVFYDAAAEARWRLAGLAFQPPTVTPNVHTGGQFPWLLVAVPLLVPRPGIRGHAAVAGMDISQAEAA